MNAWNDLGNPWERELNYYRRECNELGARLLRAQEDQSKVVREARRSRIVAKLVREVYRLGDLGGTVADITRSTLEIVVENAMCDRAILLREAEAGSGRFSYRHTIGMPDGDTRHIVDLRRPPVFLFASGQAIRDDAAAQLSAVIRLPHILWGYDPNSRFGLLLGNKAEHNTTPPFEEGDRELVDTALSVYLDALYRERMRARSQRVEPDASAVAFDDAAPASPGAGIQEAEIKDGLRVGGRTTGFLVVERPGGQYSEYVAYINVSWSRGYRILRMFRDRGDRTYRDLGRLIQFARSECGFTAPVRVYTAGTPELKNIGGIRPSDLQPEKVAELAVESRGE